MTDKLRNVRIYGKAGTEFGRVHRLAVKTPAEALRALSVIIPGFKKYLNESESKGIRYAIFTGKTNLSEDDLHNPSGDEDIRIAPILQGSKRGGLFQTLVGAALVLIGTFFPPAAFLVPVGYSLAIGGVMQMLSPQQKGLSSKDGPNNGASYNFNGPVNTTAQGNAVPILYGRQWIGGATISSAVYSEDQA